MTSADPTPNPAPDAEAVEQGARAICLSRDINPDCLYQHNFEGDYPEDERREYSDAITGEPRVQLFHRAWRHHEKAARAALAAIRAFDLSAFATPPSSSEAARREREYIADRAVILHELRDCRPAREGEILTKVGTYRQRSLDRMTIEGLLEPVFPEARPGNSGRRYWQLPNVALKSQEPRG